MKSLVRTGFARIVARSNQPLLSAGTSAFFCNYGVLWPLKQDERKVALNVGESPVGHPSGLIVNVLLGFYAQPHSGHGCVSHISQNPTSALSVSFFRNNRARILIHWLTITYREVVRAWLSVKPRSVIGLTTVPR